jgi:integrase
MCIFTETKKGIMKTKAETIPFEKAVFVANKLVGSKKEIIGLFIAVGINTGLRGGDILSLTWENLLSDSFVINEQKTNKDRTINVNNELKNYIKRIHYKMDGLVFTSQKKSVFTIQQVNRVLKELFEESKFQNVSTHSLRKTFGRRVYDKNGKTEHALIKLSEVFGHSNIQITRTYLGLKAEEIADIYMNLH